MANISELSIKRPVLSTVMVIVILLFGFIGYQSLGVREFPSVDRPIITVTTTYPGANAEVIMNQITEPLEQNVNGIPGIRSLTSSSSVGNSRITVEFELSVDLETAANDVRDKVSRAQRYLPRDCDPPTVSKADADATPIMQIGIRSQTRSLMELSELAEIIVKERLQTIPNVSGVEIWGQKRYSMRLWLDPTKMGGYGVTPIDVLDAVTAENVELPSGSIEGNTVDLSIRTMGLMTTAQEFNNLIIKENKGRIVRFQDVGRAELAPEDLRSVLKRNGEPMVIDIIIPQPGANHIEIADEAYKRIEQLRKDLPEDVEIEMVYDNTRFIRASIAEVEETIYVAFLLVVLIIFLFLRDWRVTLVPIMVIPVSLVGAFFVMYIAGFSINVLSLLAVVLSVGLVVDDAIVVTENIYVRIENGMNPKEAGIEGAIEIFFAVISTTITLIAVFIPIVFMEGMTGRLFNEFSIVIAGSVAISAFVALTFTPMLATKLLKKREQQNWFYRKTEPFFVWLNHIYETGLNFFLNRRWMAICVVVVLAGAIGYLWNNIPSELAPLEDRSILTVNMRGPEGTTFEFIRDFSDRIEFVSDSLVPERQSVMTRSFGSAGFMNVFLPDIRERERSQMEIAEVLSEAVSKETQARAFVQQQSTFGGRRAGMPVQYVLQANDIERLREFLPEFMQKVNESPVFQMADVNLKFTKPETRIEIDRDKASLLGVSTRNIAQTLQYALSGQRMGYFYLNGKQYQILGEINRQQRNTPLNLKSIYVRSESGAMIQLDNLVTLREEVAPPQLYRYNRFIAATVSSGLNRGYTLGDGLNEMDRIAEEVLDDTFRTALSGESKEFRESSDSLMFALVLALVMIYLVLAAQFESFKDPLIVMFTVPLAIAGALLFMHMADITMNIFSQIGIIMLIGLVAKNGILIVEFANQRQEAGLSLSKAIRMASLQRLRPILMTSTSTILGLIPLVFASAEGANQRIAMGTAVVGGMLVSTFLTLFIVPAMYSYISTDRSKREQLASPADLIESKENNV
ncbi:MAG: efflux RND transporter permease subunit [Tannerellaceae bacterium]|jgi:multidrug efflux pump|nr:efflux RND transporter permease subunit [Tannerellaceae bacterium]